MRRPGDAGAAADYDTCIEKAIDIAVAAMSELAGGVRGPSLPLF